MGVRGRVRVKVRVRAPPLRDIPHAHVPVEAGREKEVRPAAHHDVEAAHGVGVACERDRRAAVWVPQPDRAWLGLGVGLRLRLGVGVGVGMPNGSVPG